MLCSEYQGQKHSTIPITFWWVHHLQIIVEQQIACNLRISVGILSTEKISNRWGNSWCKRNQGALVQRSLIHRPIGKNLFPSLPIQGDPSWKSSTWIALLRLWATLIVPSLSYSAGLWKSFWEEIDQMWCFKTTLVFLVTETRRLKPFAAFPKDWGGRGVLN